MPGKGTYTIQDLEKSTAIKHTQVQLPVIEEYENIFYIQGVNRYTLLVLLYTTRVRLQPKVDSTTKVFG